jgi:hypothetical protein
LRHDLDGVRACDVGESGTRSNESDADDEVSIAKWGAEPEEERRGVEEGSAEEEAEEADPCRANALAAEAARARVTTRVGSRETM